MFNSLKSQLIAFGGQNPSHCPIILNDSQIPWSTRVKYLGLQLCVNNGITDVSNICRKFYGQFNNIMSVLGSGSREMSALHLTKTFCLPTILYGCEVWSLSSASLHRINVAWNNCFRRMFHCCWRERVSDLFNIFATHYHYHILLIKGDWFFWRSLYRSENVVLRTLACLNRNYFVALAAKYGSDDYMSDIKSGVWRSFSNSVMIWWWFYWSY